MPVYEYACEKCGHEFEAEQRITDDPIKTCPKCKARKVKRLISQTSFVLKGGGWYSDLYSLQAGQGARTTTKSDESGEQRAQRRRERSPADDRERSDERRPRATKSEARAAKDSSSQGQGQGARSPRRLRPEMRPPGAIETRRRRRARTRQRDPQGARRGRSARLVAAGRRAPCLAVVLVGDDPASASYIKGKRRACERVGMDSRRARAARQRDRAPTCSRVVAELNARPRRRRHPRAAAAAEAARRATRSRARSTRPRTSTACTRSTPAACCSELPGARRLHAARDHRRSSTATAIPLEGAHAVVIGRSNIVGKPVSLLLQQRQRDRDACATRARATCAALCREADVLVAAVGVAAPRARDWIKPGAAVIDVGVHAWWTACSRATSTPRRARASRAS